MTSPLTEAREVLAAALASSGVRVYPQPVEAPSPPCLQVFGGTEWIKRPRLQGGQVDVGLVVRVTVPVVSGNPQALAAIEDLVWEVMRLIPVVGEVAAPRFENANQIDVYMVDLPTVVKASN